MVRSSDQHYQPRAELYYTRLTYTKPISGSDEVLAAPGVADLCVKYSRVLYGKVDLYRTFERNTVPDSDHRIKI